MTIDLSVEHLESLLAATNRHSSVNEADPRLRGTDITASILDTIGHTPLIRLKRLSEMNNLAPLLTMKMETTNPGGSAKDRPALEMILAAEASGELLPGGTIVEPTSGNTGVGLAIVAAQRGYSCVFVVTDKVAPEKVDLLRAYGAEVIVCPVAVAPDDPASYYSVAVRITHERRAYRPNQYDNPNNALAHEISTGPEIWEQTKGRITHFVAGAGTCGTVTGVARYLKSMNPAIQIVVGDPAGSVYSGGDGRPYLVEGVGEDMFPAAWDPSLIDTIFPISDAESFQTARMVTRTEGVILGGSGGMAVAAALRVARGGDANDLIVVLNPDSGRGYLSRIYNDEWMGRNGFLEQTHNTIGQLLAARSGTPELLHVNPQDSVRTAIAIMGSNGISQLPVCQNSAPFSAAEVSGALDERTLMDHVFADLGVLDAPVADVMGPSLPTIGEGQSVQRAVEMLGIHPALLVLAGGRPRAVLTRSDILSDVGRS